MRRFSENECACVQSIPSDPKQNMGGAGASVPVRNCGDFVGFTFDYPNVLIVGQVEEAFEHLYFRIARSNMK